MKTPALALMLLMFGACAHRKGNDPASDPAAAVTATERQLAQQEVALSGPQTARGKPDCTRARALRDNVCTLGQRVCLLTSGDRAIPEGAARCKRANLQCEKASTHLSGTCDKPTKTRLSRR